MIRVVPIVVGSMKSTIKEIVNCSVPSESVSSVMVTLKHSLELSLTVANASLSC